jgi:hypothetical protein
MRGPYDFNIIETNRKKLAIRTYYDPDKMIFDKRSYSPVHWTCFKRLGLNTAANPNGSATARQEKAIGNYSIVLS